MVVESAIDALSYKQLHLTNDLVISIGGNSNKEALQHAIDSAKTRNVPLVSAFDSDKGGDIGHAHLTALSDISVIRELPVFKDWNEQLVKLNSVSIKNTANIKIPSVEIPSISIPNVEIPDIKIPEDKQ